MTIILDSNTFVASLNSFSPFHNLFRGLLEGKFHAHVTTDIIFEYLEIFQEKFSHSKSAFFYNIIVECPYVIDTDVHFKWGLISVDPDDNKFVDCAIAANADYIVTNDKHFNVLKQISFPNVKCITIEEFMEILKEL